MTLSDLFQFLILLTPIVLARRGAKLWSLIASVGALHVATSVLTRLLMEIMPALFRPAGAGATLPDSYYVATPPGYLVTSATLWTSLALATWMLERNSALHAPRLARSLFWSLLGAQAAGWFIPRLFTGALVAFDGSTPLLTVLTQAVIVVTLAALLALAGLIALLLYSAINLARRPR